MHKSIKESVLLVLGTALALGVHAQNMEPEAPKGWHTLDKSKDGVYGISLEKAYDLVKGKKSQTVVVAVIDSGIDTTHEDLKPVLWRNPKEIPGNGKDDDKNGYVDDIYGWNFIGGKDGRNVKEDSYEVARVYHKFKSKFKDVKDASQLSKDEQATFAMWKRAEKEIAGSGTDSGMQLMILTRTFEGAVKNDSILRKAMNKDSYTGEQLEAYTPTTDVVRKAKNAFLFFFQANNSMDMTNVAFLDEFEQYLSGEKKKAEAANVAPKSYRAEIVGDKYDDFNDRYYGNNDVMASTPFHGTHVSGIIAAVRKNGKGMDGIADNVRIMSLRAVPDGDEHDKDVALAIRYAVDNGAKIINMSFGKGYSPEKNWVDEAIKYAESKGVLLVHAAGNAASNIDTSYNFPTSVMLDGNEAPNYISVGASGPAGKGLVASFSNFGKSNVDVFAPGVKIYSTIPGGNTYGNAQGTSMASPVVAGVAAFVLSYYPNLTPFQLKYVIENSVSKVAEKAINPSTGEEVSLSELSKTGGVVNAAEAIRLAEQVSKGGKVVTQPNSNKPTKADKKKEPVKSF